MSTLLKKIRPSRTKTTRLGSGESVENPHGQDTCEPAEQLPGLQSSLEFLQLLYVEDESSAVPEGLPENHPGLQKQPSQGGISVLPWNMFMNDPRRLADLLHVRPDHHISYDSSNVNALFQATFMDNPSFGEISAKGDAWIVAIETRQELERLRSRLCTQTTVLGMSIARRLGKWQTAHAVPCLMMIDPEDESTRQAFTQAFDQAVLSLENGKNFSLDINLNPCVEVWCEGTLGTRCQSLGARILITNGEPYMPALSTERLLCCVLCLPLWGLQTCLYQIQRKSVYNDYPINPTIVVKLHDSAWVKQERRHTEVDDDDDDVIGMSHGDKSRDTGAQRNVDRGTNITNVEKAQHGNQRPKKRKDKRKSSHRSNISTGQHNSGFEVDNSDTSSTPTDIQNPQHEKTGNFTVDSVTKMKHLNGVITGEMLLTDNVELVRFAKIDDRHLIKEMEKHRGNTRTIPVESRVDSRSSTDSGILNGDDQDGADGDICHTRVHGVGSTSSKTQYTPKETRFLRTGSQLRLSPSDSESMSSSPQNSSPADSQSLDGVLKNRRVKQNRFFTKPKGILKENGKPGVKVSGNGVDEFERSERSAPERPSTAIPNQRHSVHFHDEQTETVWKKSSQSWGDQQSTISYKVEADGRVSGKIEADDRVSGKIEAESIKVQSRRPHTSDEITNDSEKQSTPNQSPPSTAIPDGMLTNAWSFAQPIQVPTGKRGTAPSKQPVAPNPKSFLRPKAKVVFSTDEEDNATDWRSNTSGVILVNGSQKGDRVLDSMDLEKDTETDTEVSQFRLEDVGDEQEVNYLSDSHISVTRAITKKQHNKARVRRQPSNPRKYQSANLPRKRLYNPKKQTISMLDLDVGL